MTLHRKFALTVLALTVGYLLVGYSILRAVVSPTFSALESRAARVHAARVEDTFHDIELEISLVNVDWAQWDDSVEFLQAPVGSETYEAYKKANLKVSDMVNYDLDLLLLFDARDRLVWGQFLIDDSEIVPLEEVLIAPFEPGDPLLAHEDPVGSINGLLQTRLGPVIISSRPIVSTEALGPPEGTMIMGRLLDSDRVGQIGQKTDSEFSVFQTAHDELAPDVRRALDHAPPWPEDPLSEADDEILLTYSRLNDVYGQPAFLLQVRTPREIAAAGATTLRLAALFLILASALFAGGLWLLLRRLVATEAQRGAMEEARDAALEVARLKSEFLATMSHEMRTPMNGVIGFSGLLLDTALTDRQRGFAEDIQRSTEGLLSIINDVLDFSKIEVGKMTSEARDFDLRTVLEEVASMFSQSAQESSLELACDISPELDGAWRGDSDRLRQVLINLVGNAFKFTIAGEVLIRAYTVSSDGEAPPVRIEVRDTGIGIEPNRQESVFDSFTQADASTTREFGGTGLGLAICKRIIEMMGGAIGVQSEPGEGSTFWLEMPLERGAAASPPDLDGIRDLRVLVVDDNATSRSLLCAQLDVWGVRCRAVGSGREALETLRQASSPFHVVLLDQAMPDMDGPALARSIAGEPGLENLPLVLMSFVPLSEGREPPGVRSRLRKPVRAGELLGCLRPARTDAAEETSRRASDEGDAKRSRALDVRILLVEDNPVNQRVALAMLEEMRCRVDVALNGREALSLLERNPYDLVLMDCQMPVMDGYETTETLRCIEANRGTESPIPIIALTAYAVEGDRERCLAAGMNDYLTKPFKKEQLRNRIDHWLGGALVASSNAAPASSDEPQAEREAEAMLDKGALDMIREIESPDCPNLLGDLVQSYRETSRELLEELEASIREGDAERMGRAAHSLKSSSANLGASALAALSRELERLGRAGDLSGVKDLFARLSDEYPRVLRALETELGTDRS